MGCPFLRDWLSLKKADFLGACDHAKLQLYSCDILRKQMPHDTVIVRWTCFSISLNQAQIFDWLKQPNTPKLPSASSDSGFRLTKFQLLF